MEPRGKGDRRDKEIGRYHGPSLNAVLDHQVLGHGRRDLRHVVPVVLLAHAGAAVAADGEAEELAVGAVAHWRRGFWEGGGGTHG